MTIWFVYDPRLVVCDREGDCWQHYETADSNRSKSSYEQSLFAAYAIADKKS